MSSSRKKAERLARELRDAQLRTVLSTPAGKAFVWRLLTNVTGVFGPSFSSDPALTAFNEGKRSVGLALMKEAQRVAPGSYLEMTEERINADLLALEPEAPELEPEDDPDASGDSSPEG